MKRRLLPALLLLALSTAPAGAAELWSEARTAFALNADGPQPHTFRRAALDVAGAHAALRAAVVDGTPFALPHPDGAFAEFVLEDSQTMSPELAAKFPQILSLRGRDAQGNRVRVDLSDLGLQALVFDRDGSWIVQPNTFGAGGDYISFRRADSTTRRRFHCDTHDRDETPDEHASAGPGVATVTGASRRILRTAVAATGEYTAVFGGTVAQGQAAIVVAMNRVNEVYGNEFSVTMQLVANNNLVVYTNGGTDPYSNNDGGAMLAQNQSNLTSVIGTANYDVGHVFSTGGGGVATLNAICNDGSKARGVTGLGNPLGDPFYIDYVAHEIGHQYGGSHTFNSSAGACSGNRSSGAAYEPGSASTIQGYAGICGSDDLQPNSDPYFHAKSLEQMQARLDAVPNCGTSTPNPSRAPAIPAMTATYAIPAQTPFTLLAPLATDADNDALTYGWEEYDLGASTAVNVDNGTSPIVRSWNPGVTRGRTIPRPSNLFANTTATGEILPTMNRTSMKFRLTVRDNHAGGGRSTSADMPGIQVVAAAGPFVVTAPNTAVSWDTGVTQIVTWNVAGTTAAPISCANVNIDLTRNGGNSWLSLASNVPNDGSHGIVLPSGTAAATARIRVSCSSNIFFDISNVNFTIVQSDVIFRNAFQ
ncbi:MAG TPA: zinc-dependent metalloprotease family protein [Tahibacter sp.]|uniref:reprolysin-like metallopeptidase n=1 Tax=Tahibacter sp. TaxID=2056211 RepID=UPI002CD4CB0A|nr:zinc-dependent metalloprotease family protein [Tahibacter sp.]HSX62078.1 zinc-dependent metalloprotease family protein [Tahibacter sp.]